MVSAGGVDGVVLTGVGSCRCSMCHAHAGWGDTHVHISGRVVVGTDQQVQMTARKTAVHHESSPYSSALLQKYFSRFINNQTVSLKQQQRRAGTEVF